MSALRCGSVLRYVLRSGSVRFSDIVKPTVRCGACGAVNRTEPRRIDRKNPTVKNPENTLHVPKLEQVAKFRFKHKTKKFPPAYSGSKRLAPFICVSVRHIYFPIIKVPGSVSCLSSSFCVFYEDGITSPLGEVQV